MGFFSRIGQAIVSGVQRIFGRPPKVEEPQQLTPIQEPEIIQIEKPKRKGAGSEIEADALRRAVEMVIEANQHPGDATYDQAKQDALVYINKSQKLAEKGATQSGNRKYIAGRYLKSELSTPEGVADRKARKLAVFNANFGFDLSEEEADVVGQIMKSSSFKKLMEMYRAMYDIIIGMVGDQVEAGIDPVRIEQSLDLWVQMGIEPEFNDFAALTELPTQVFVKLQNEILQYNEETLHADEFEQMQAKGSILNKWLNWEEWMTDEEMENL